MPGAVRLIHLLYSWYPIPPCHSLYPLPLPISLPLSLSFSLSLFNMHSKIQFTLTFFSKVKPKSIFIFLPLHPLSHYSYFILNTLYIHFAPCIIHFQKTCIFLNDFLS